MKSNDSILQILVGLVTLSLVGAPCQGQGGRNDFAPGIALAPDAIDIPSVRRRIVERLVKANKQTQPETLEIRRVFVPGHALGREAAPRLFVFSEWNVTLSKGGVGRRWGLAQVDPEAVRLLESYVSQAKFDEAIAQRARTLLPLEEAVRENAAWCAAPTSCDNNGMYDYVAERPRPGAVVVHVKGLPEVSLYRVGEAVVGVWIPVRLTDVRAGSIVRIDLTQLPEFSANQTLAKAEIEAKVVYAELAHTAPSIGITLSRPDGLAGPVSGRGELVTFLGNNRSVDIWNNGLPKPEQYRAPLWVDIDVSSLGNIGFGPIALGDAIPRATLEISIVLKSSAGVAVDLLRDARDRSKKLAGISMLGGR